MASGTKVNYFTNLTSYTSSVMPIPTMPSERELSEVTHMMQDVKCMVPEVKNLKALVDSLLPVRGRTLCVLNETIEDLNEHHRNVNIAKVTGNSVSLVGDGVMAGGLIAAPFTLGISLIVTAVGGGICAVGGATSAGAGLAELAISKKKVAEIQGDIDKDNERSKEVQKVWASIITKCEEVSKRYNKYSMEDVVGVLLVCSLKEKAGNILEKGSHAFDVVAGLGSGAWSIQTGGQAIGGAVLTALVIRFAPKGAKAVTHCARMAGISNKVVTAAKIFRVATGVSPLSIAFTIFGTGLDIASLIYSSYQIHKRTDSSAGKELIKRRNELQEGKERLEHMRDCLHGLLCD